MYKQISRHFTGDTCNLLIMNTHIDKAVALNSRSVHFLQCHFDSGSLVKIVRSGVDLGWFSQVEVRRDKVLLHNPIFGDLYLRSKDKVLVFLKDLYDSVAYSSVRESRYQELGAGSGKLPQVQIYKNERILPNDNKLTVQTITRS